MIRWIAILFSSFLFWSNHVTANECELPVSYTKEDVLHSQNCIKGAIAQLDKSLVLAEDFREVVKGEISTMITEAGECLKYKALLEERPDNPKYQAFVEGCERYHEKKLTEWLDVKQKIDEAKENSELLTSEKSVLEDLNNFLERVRADYKE